MCYVPANLCSSLALKVEVFENAEQKVKRLASILKARTGPAIVYVTLQKHAEEVSNSLRAHQLDAMIYHAGLPSEERERVQQQFMDSEQGIVVATIAFGMGIDKGEYFTISPHFLSVEDCMGRSEHPTGTPLLYSLPPSLLRSCRSSTSICPRRSRTTAKRLVERVATACTLTATCSSARRTYLS